MAIVRDYYLLTKPGIVYGNSWHVLGGILFAAGMWWSWTAAIGVLVGTALVIASACVINNLLDRRYDRHMERTKQRASVTGEIKLSQAVLFAAIMAIGGFAVIAATTNLLTLLLGVVAYLSYAFIYTYSKRFTVHSTVIGTLPGALPAMAGYTALSGQLDMMTWFIGLVIALWQLPHFYAISVFRHDEYKRAGLPVLSTRLPNSHMRTVILSTITMFVAAVIVFAILVLTPIAGVAYVGLALWWLAQSWQGGQGKIWARRVFGNSMYVSLGFVFVAALDFASRSVM